MNPNAANDEDNEDKIDVGAFIGICYNCRKDGHKFYQCPDKKNSSEINLNRNCNNCGKWGHRAVDFWEMGENKDKRPEWWKSKNDQNTKNAQEQVTAALGMATSVEYLFAGINFLNNEKLLSDPKIWIADSVATVHTTADENGAELTENENDGATIRMGNGTSKNVTKTAKIPETVCNKHGNVAFKMTFGDVAICLNAKYNLFSVTKMMQNGWSLSGDKTTMVLRRGQHTIKFDIMIPTPKGAIYCMKLKRTPGETKEAKKILPVNWH